MRPAEARGGTMGSLRADDSASPWGAGVQNDGQMFPRWMRLRASARAALSLVVLVLAGCAGTEARHAPTKPPAAAPTAATRPTTPVTAASEGVLLGIDVLEQQGFRPLLGKRVGLLTHAAAVNRFGVNSVEVLRRDKRVRLTALYGVEHGIYGTVPAGEHYQDQTDPATGLPVYSLYSGRSRKPTPAQLAPIDVLVVDLQDIGSRSYTFIAAMRLAIEACFENGREVVVLDRPNPLGGWKVSGPPLDAEWINYLAAFRVPYVHGLTIGELARLAVGEPGTLQVADSVRRRGKLTVIALRGWRRDMTWPQTGLRWTPTSPNIPSFDAVVGYPMTGLGAQLGGFRHGIGTPYPFRLLSHPALSQADLLAELNRRKLGGLRFTARTITLPPLPQARDRSPRTVAGVYAEVVDWRAWRPTELSFHLMQIACARSLARNPFAAASKADAELFNKHTGSNAWWKAIVRDGARVDVSGFLDAWERDAAAFQQRSRRYWLYR